MLKFSKKAAVTKLIGRAVNKIKDNPKVRKSALSILLVVAMLLTIIIPVGDVLQNSPTALAEVYVVTTVDGLDAADSGAPLAVCAFICDCEYEFSLLCNCYCTCVNRLIIMETPDEPNPDDNFNLAPPEGEGPSDSEFGNDYTADEGNNDEKQAEEPTKEEPEESADYDEFAVETDEEYKETDLTDDEEEEEIEPSSLGIGIEPFGTLVRSGTWGTVNWRYYSDGTLTFSGGTTGATTQRPWNSPFIPEAEHFNPTRLVILDYVVINANGSQSTFQGLSVEYMVDFHKVSLSSGARDLWRMFHRMPNLKSLDLSGFDTSLVTSMSGMFEYMPSLTSINFGNNFNTSNVTNMSSMFSFSRSLPTIDLSGFDTSSVTNMQHMFSSMSSLHTLDLRDFDTSSVLRMDSMFGMNPELTTLYICGFDTSSVTDMPFMFMGARSLTSLDLSHFDTSRVTRMNSMFSGMDLVESIDVSSFNTSLVSDMRSMFAGTNNLRYLDLSNFNTHNVNNANMNNMFLTAWNRPDLGEGLRRLTLGPDFVFRLGGAGGPGLEHPTVPWFAYRNLPYTRWERTDDPDNVNVVTGPELMAHHNANRPTSGNTHTWVWGGATTTPDPTVEPPDLHFGIRNMVGHQRTYRIAPEFDSVPQISQSGSTSITINDPSADPWTLSVSFQPNPNSTTDLLYRWLQVGNNPATRELGGVIYTSNGVAGNTHTIFWNNLINTTNDNLSRDIRVTVPHTATQGTYAARIVWTVVPGLGG